MSKTVVVTDSCASLPDEMYGQYGITMVPYYIHIGQQQLRDLVDVQREEFFDYLGRATELPKTANPGPGDYQEVYRAAVAQGNDVISIHMTSHGSGAYGAACVARDTVLSDYPSARIEVVDTLNVSMCHGWITLEAARAAQAGQTTDAIMGIIAEIMPKVKMIQTADTLRYLYMGGRIGRATHLMGSALNIKPLIGMEQGVIVALGQARGRPAAYRCIAEMVERDAAARAVKLAVVHAAAHEAAEELRALVAERVQIAETIITQLSPALAVHTGPGTVGVCYYPLDR
ncbi:MAG: DegV family protein [Chloroflexi bacterium]|nr:DegV family protein [Chloroflexota bacterium]